MARFNQTHFNSPAEKQKAHAAVMRAAKKFGIDTSNFESFSQSQNDIEHSNEKEDMSMEQTTEKSNSEHNESELTEMKKTIEALKAEKEALEKDKAQMVESQRIEAYNKYKSLCESKKLTSQDLSKATMEMIQFAIKTIESLPEDEEEDEESDEDEEESEESVKKPVAEVKSKNAKVESTVKEDLDNYVVTTEDVSGPGVALYKNY